MAKEVRPKLSETSAKAKTSAKTKANAAKEIEKASEAALEKLKELNLDIPLQAEIQWCLGSYRQDKNPVGLYIMAERALTLFKAEQIKKTKGVTSKLTGDIEKALKNK